MKILLFGSNGQLGWELQRALAPLGCLTAYHRQKVDLNKPQQLRKAIDECCPDIIVNAAAFTAVDKAEKEPEAAFAINAEAVSVLAAEVAKSDALLVHYSTDYVFDGNKSGAYCERDTPNPLSIYGQSKLQGEKAIKASGCNHLILRTSWVYGARGNNFAKTMLKLAKERESLRIIDDQIGAPTSAELIADITAHCLYHRRLACKEAHENLQGTFHLTASGETSWYGFASFLLQEALSQGFKLKTSLNQVIPIPTSEYPLPAKRPQNSRLDTKKLSEVFKLHLPDWQTQVRRLINELKGR